MAFPGRNYAPPGIYTSTEFENPLAGALDSLKIPILVGEGSETLTQSNLEVVRGSSSIVDQRVVFEDETGRAVVAVSATGVVTLGSFDGARTKFQVRNFPIVTGDGTGTTTTNRSDVSVTYDGQPVVVRSVAGATGIVEVAQAPQEGQLVRCTYFFNRTDTQVTDDLSAQVTAEMATLRGAVGISDVNAPNAGSETLEFYEDVTDADGNVLIPANNTFVLQVNGVTVSVLIPPNSYTMTQIAAVIATASSKLTSGTYVDNYGKSALYLSAEQSLSIGAGSANEDLGFVEGATTARTRTFYTHNGPIVDGSGGGITTTDPADVTVKVNGVQVIPTAVDGLTRAITLPVAPKPGATVSVTYYHNTWQDTYDLLQHIHITRVTQSGNVPGVSSFLEGTDFLLKDDKILWGTSSLVSSGTTTSGYESFGEAQVRTLLVDNKVFMAPCAPVVSSATGISVESRKDFQLPLQPTLGNGRDTQIGQSLFQTLANSRIDLPVNRPDVVKVYWGYGVNDAMARGPVTVTKVEGLVVTLASAVPVGADVFATFYYNLLTDNEYTLEVVSAGASGTGTYQITDSNGDFVLGASFDPASKGSSLTGVTINFPSGSELLSDLRFEVADGEDFVGPVEEIVTVRFASRTATPAKFAVSGYGPYDIQTLQSDRAAVTLDNVTMTYGAAGLSLTDPSTFGAGFFASLAGEEIEYTGGTNATEGETYTLDTDEDLNLDIDDVAIRVTIPAQEGVTAAAFVSAINEWASGHQGAAQGGGASTVTLAATASDVDDFYVGWKVVMGYAAVDHAAAGESFEITAYDGATQVATIDGAWVGGSPVAGDAYYIYYPDHMAKYVATTQFNGPVVVAASEFDSLRFTYTGTAATATLTATLTPGTYATPSALATEVETQMNAAVAAAVAGASPELSGLEFFVSADGSGRLVFTMQLAGVDAAAYLAFLTASGTVATDFAILAGISTASAASGAQAKMLQGPVARLFTPSTSVTKKHHDRVVLRNRLIPGTNALAPTVQEQMHLEVLAGNGNTKAGFTAGQVGLGGISAVTQAAFITGRMGFAGGQDAAGQPLVTFYDGSGVRAANNTFIFSLDGYPVTVTFTASDSGTATPLGPLTGTSNGSVLDQIVDAVAAVSGAPFGNAAAVASSGLLSQIGAGFQLRSQRSDTRSVITIGAGKANSLLGFSEGSVAQRSRVEAKTLASAFMANRHNTFATWMHTFASVTAGPPAYFAALGLAATVLDSTNQEYLYLQSMSLGSGSVIEWDSATVAGVSTRDVLFYGVGLLVQPGEGASGEAAVDGFFVVSSNPAGSGSVGSSVLNNGVGQDGVVGQTYTDAVTGLTFTILPRGFQNNPLGPWIAYPTGANATFRIGVSQTYVANANKPHQALSGVELTVANTSGTNVGDTAIVETFERGGNEPAVGDVYYVSYEYAKDTYDTIFFTKLSSIEGSYGQVSADNPVSLASYLAMRNGAVLVGIKQVLREEDSSFASLTSYRNAIDDLERPLPGQVNPDMILLLKGDSTELFQYLSSSLNKMSSIRYRSERTAIIGLAGGRAPKDAASTAQVLQNTRMSLVYPDAVTVRLTNALGQTQESLVEGPFLAAALVGSVVSPNYDVATPWTNRDLVGFVQLARQLDVVEANQLASKGVTVLVDRPPFITVRQGLTTDMRTLLSKTPTVILIADEVQRQSRSILSRFYGIKFLPGVLTQVEGRIAQMFKQLVKAQIVAAFTGIRATPSAVDPTIAEVQGFYQPVFPLLYLVLTYHMRGNLT